MIWFHISGYWKALNLCKCLTTSQICNSNTANSCTTQSQVRYTLREGEKINQILFIGDLKLHGKTESKIKGSVATVEVFNQDRCVEFGIKNSGVIITDIGKVKSTDGIELPYGENIIEIEEDGYKYLGILTFYRTKEQEMKDKLRNEYFRRTELIFKSKLNGRNKIMKLHILAVSIMRYGAEILNGSKNELREVDRKTTKFMTMNKELRPRSDVARLYVSRKKDGRGFIGCENSVKSEEKTWVGTLKTK